MFNLKARKAWLTLAGMALCAMLGAVSPAVTGSAAAEGAGKAAQLYTFHVNAFNWEDMDLNPPNDSPLDLHAEILFNGQSFTPQVFTPYLFGAPGHMPAMEGTYSVNLAGWENWMPNSLTIDFMMMDMEIDFIGAQAYLPPVELSSFTATLLDSPVRVQLTWVSESETNMYGYHVYRSETANLGDAVRITSYMIPATNTNTQQTYTFIDNEVEDGHIYYYWLEAEDLSGSSEFYGPISIFIDDTVPVELSSFTAMLTVGNDVLLTWVTQSEIYMLGYRLHRSMSNDLPSAFVISSWIPATNTSSQHVYTYVDIEPDIGTNYYWLESANLEGDSEFFGPLSISVESTPVEDEVAPGLSDANLIRKIYPNPFRADSGTRIELDLKAGDAGRASICNLRGQTVRSFGVDPGTQVIAWDGRDESGSACGSGIYFLRLSSGGHTQTRKMLLLK